MHFSRGFIYKCLLADQTSPRSYGGAKLMLRAWGQKEQKREAIILPIHRCFLLVFHPLEAQEVHLQTIWYLEIWCESWGNARAQQYPRGSGGALRLTPLPNFPWHSFLHEFPYHTSASVSPSWPATPVLHYSAENNTHTETGKLYFICQPHSTPEKPLELIHYAAFDSLLLRGWVEVLGALQEGLSQGLYIEVWAHQVMFELSSSNCFITAMCCFSLSYPLAMM